MGLTEGVSYTATTDSGETATGTAAAMNNGGGMGGGMGGDMGTAPTDGGQAPGDGGQAPGNNG